ncbi:hypothetical protein B5G12_10645 [Faecalibacterium sp. An58]|nr:hypothetical protein B5G12_10645 [Faecalibacterium sp. An58]OUQ37118.1 hypothetical protein B5E66_09315 [Faecalibacterium sp. An121]
MGKTSFLVLGCIGKLRAARPFGADIPAVLSFRIHLSIHDFVRKGNAPAGKNRLHADFFRSKKFLRFAQKRACIFVQNVL